MNRVVAFKIFYVMMTILLLANFVMFFYDFQFRGYWTEKIISWIWIISTIILIVQFWKNKWIKIYTGFLSILILLSLVPFALFFTAFVCFNTSMCDEQRLTISPQYRLEILTRGFMGRTNVEIYQAKNVLFEKRVIDFGYHDFTRELLKLSDRLEQPHFDEVVLMGENAQGLNVKYILNGKSKIIFHEFKQNDKD